MKKFLLACLCIIILLTGCGNTKKGQIDYMKAKELIINEQALLIDVRTAEEFNENHIEGALLLSLENIDENTTSQILTNKEAKLIVYCKSGKRSAEAKTKLESLGYKNVYDLGSIDNWKE